MAQKSRDRPTHLSADDPQRPQQQQQHHRRRESPPEVTERAANGRHIAEANRNTNSNNNNGGRSAPAPITTTRINTTAKERDDDDSGGGVNVAAAQLRVVINRFGLLELDLADRGLRRVPDAVFALSRLEVLRVGRNRLAAIQPAVSGLRNVRHLDVGNNEIVELPTTLAACSRLVELDCRGNRLTSIPPTLPAGLARHLRVLRLAGNRIEELPADLGRLTALRRLDVSGNRLRDLPASVGDLRELTVLGAADNGFDRLPVGVCRLSNLETLDLSRNQLSDLPDAFDRLRRLRELRLAANRFDSVPDPVCRTTGLVVIDISDNAVTSIPAGLAGLPRLVELDARRNAVDRFPDMSSSATKTATTCWPCLERLNVSGNRLRSLPVGSMTRLRRLDADRNWLTEAPNGVHRLAALESLGLAGNRIAHLSADLAQLKRLRVLDVADNALTSIPPAVEQMPGLETLDVTGNPMLTSATSSKKRNDAGLHRRQQRNGGGPGYPVAYVVDGRSGPPPPGAVPLVFAQSPSGLLYATPTAAVPLARSNGHAATAAVGASSTSSSKSGSRGILGLFRSKNGVTTRNGGVGNRGHGKIGLNAGTQTATSVGGQFPFPVVLTASDAMSSSMMMSAAGADRLLSSGAATRPRRPVNNNNGSSSTASGRRDGGDVDSSASRRALDSADRTLSIGDLDDLESIRLSASSPRPPDGRRQHHHRPWKSTTTVDVDVMSAWSPLLLPQDDDGDRRRGGLDADAAAVDDEDGRCSDTVTVNDEVGDRLSLGEDDFEFLPPNVHDDKLMRIAGDLETLLNRQLLDPIVDGRRRGGSDAAPAAAARREPSGMRSAAEGVQLEREMAAVAEAASGGNVNGRNADIDDIFDDASFDRNPLHSSASAAIDVGHRRRPNGAVDDSADRRNPDRSSKPWRQSGTTSGGEVARLLPADIVVVGPSGGLFRSTTNPDVSVYVPQDAVDTPITLRMQVIRVGLESSADPNLLAVGDIVSLSDVTAGSERHRRRETADRDRHPTPPPLLRQHVTVTVPTPHVVGGGIGAVKMHVLTYRSADANDDDVGGGGGGVGAGAFPSTCLPCAYDYATARRGLISIRAWHFTGLGAVLTKTGNAFTACRSMERLLRQLNSVRSSSVSAML